MNGRFPFFSPTVSNGGDSVNLAKVTTLLTCKADESGNVIETRARGRFQREIKEGLLLAAAGAVTELVSRYERTYHYESCRTQRLFREDSRRFLFC
jgi:hypothetical protein